MQGKEIHELATICTRYAKLNTAAKLAESNLVKARFELFTDFITESELATLKEAEAILNRISGTTSQTDAVKYFNSIQNQITTD